MVTFIVVTVEYKILAHDQPTESKILFNVGKLEYEAIMSDIFFCIVTQLSNTLQYLCIYIYFCLPLPSPPYPMGKLWKWSFVSFAYCSIPVSGMHSLLNKYLLCEWMIWQMSSLIRISWETLQSACICPSHRVPLQWALANVINCSPEDSDVLWSSRIILWLAGRYVKHTR